MVGGCILLATDTRIPFREKFTLIEKKALGRSRGHSLSVTPGSGGSKPVSVRGSLLAYSETPPHNGSLSQ